MKKAFALLFALVFTASVSAQSIRGSSAGANLSSVSTNILPETDNAVTLGSSAKRWSNTFATTLTSGALTAPASTGLTLTSNVSDSVSAVGVSFAIPALATAGARLFELKEDGADRFYVDATGHILPGATSTYALGNGSAVWSDVWAANVRGTAFLNISAAASFQLTSSRTAGASNYAFYMNTTNSWTSGQLLRIANSGTEKFTVYYDGSFVSAAATLQTCAAATEGLIARDAAAGGSSGSRTRICICTSDGAATPAYAWQNVGSGSLGNATTCGI